LAAQKAKKEFREQIKKNEQLMSGAKGQDNNASNLIGVEEVEF